MERESVLETIKIDGVVTIQKKRFVFLGNGKNASKAVFKAWIESWRDYVDDDSADLSLIETKMGLMVIWENEFIETGGVSNLSILADA